MRWILLCLLLCHVITTNQSPTCSKKSLKSHRWNRLLFRITCRKVPPTLVITDFDFLDPSVPQDVFVVNSVIPRISRNTSLTKFQVVRKLILRNLSVEEIIPGAFAHLDTVRRLDLSFNKLRMIEGSPFDAVAHLNLSHNRIYDIDSGVFAKTGSLHKLDLNHNQLSLLWNKMFVGCSNLKFLDVSYNRIEQLQPLAFKNAHSLIKIDLSHNQIIFLHEDAFFHCPNLRIFDASYNKIKRLELNERLSEIDTFYNNTLYSVKGRFPHLLQLDLSFNTITEVKSDSFKGMINLFWKIKLGNNQIRKLEKGIFKNLALDTFDVSQNDLNRIEPKVFEDAIFLHTVDLSSNNLSTITSETLSGAAHLQHLNLQNNRLMVLPTNLIVNCPHLCSFNASYNRIRLIEDNSFKNGCNLKSLDLSHNHIWNVISFAGLQNLLNLNLAHNQITVLRKNLFVGCLLLSRFDASSNRIRYVEHTVFKNTPNLDSIDLSHNLIYKLSSGTFSELIYLISLNLEHNQISLLHGDMFSRCLHLRFVNFANNRIKRIEPNLFRSKNGVRRRLEFYLNRNPTDWVRVETFLKVFSSSCVSTMLIMETDLDQVCCGQLNLNRSYIFLALSKNNDTCKIETRC